MRVDARAAEVDLRLPRRPEIVVDEITDVGKAAALAEGERPEVVERHVFPQDSAPNVRADTQGMPALGNSERVLKLIDILRPTLRDGDTARRAQRGEPTRMLLVESDSGRLRQWIRSRFRCVVKREVRACLRDSELIQQTIVEDVDPVAAELL